MDKQTCPINPFDNEGFREEFDRRLDPISALLQKHDEQLEKHGGEIKAIKAVGSVLSILFTGLVALAAKFWRG